MYFLAIWEIIIVDNREDCNCVGGVTALRIATRFIAPLPTAAINKVCCITPDHSLSDISTPGGRFVRVDSTCTKDG